MEGVIHVEDDIGFAFLFIGGEWKTGKEQRENKWVWWYISSLDKRSFSFIFLRFLNFQIMLHFH